MYYKCIHLKQNPALLFPCYGLIFSLSFQLLVDRSVTSAKPWSLLQIIQFFFMLVIAQGLQVGEVRSCVWSAPSAAQPLCLGQH